MGDSHSYQTHSLFFCHVADPCLGHTIVRFVVPCCWPVPLLLLQPMPPPTMGLVGMDLVPLTRHPVIVVVVMMMLVVVVIVQSPMVVPWVIQNSPIDCSWTVEIGFAFVHLVYS